MFGKSEKMEELEQKIAQLESKLAAKEKKFTRANNKEQFVELVDHAMLGVCNTNEAAFVRSMAIKCSYRVINVSHKQLEYLTNLANNGMLEQEFNLDEVLTLLGPTEGA